MAEYISRDWLLTHTHTGMDTIQMMQTMIDAPAADVVEVMHGRWEERIVDDPLDPYGFFKRRWYCSSCGRYQTYGTTAFCPNCGAKMDGGVNDGKAD